MNIPALLIGLITVFLVIWHFKRTKLERSQFAYPLLLASFPFYYFVFAIYGNDFSALLNEFLTGLVFFLLAFIAIKSRKPVSLILIAVGCLVHGIYDIYHDHLFLNAGTPSWWPEFCGVIDIVLAGYLFYLASRPERK